MNILLVEDTKTIIKGLTYAFEQEGFNLISKSSVRETKEYLLNNKNINLAILDITLPDGNGFDLYKSTIKELNIPTIFLTAQDDEDKIVNALDEGAEDYITKPFSTKELIARVNRIMLRFTKKNIIKIQDISYDLEKMVLIKNKEIIELSALELKLINLLFNNINKVISRNLILDKIFDWTGNYVDDHTVTVYFKRIKDKMGTDIIKTVKGIGYRIDEK